VFMKRSQQAKTWSQACRPPSGWKAGGWDLESCVRGGVAFLKSSDMLEEVARMGRIVVLGCFFISS
jgi:hypothetical protein